MQAPETEEEFFYPHDEESEENDYLRETYPEQAHLGEGDICENKPKK